MSQVLPIRIVIADDHPRIRSWIRTLLGRERDIQVVGEAENGQVALELVRRFQPDILLLDIEMPVMDGLEVMRHLARMKNPVRILILSSYDDPEYLEQAKRLGGDGYLIKENSPHQLAGLIRQISQKGRGGADPVEAIILPLRTRSHPPKHGPRAG